MPRVSVLLPIRNAAATLGAALASLEAQTFPDFEVIAVDDGSSDATAAVLRASSASPRLRVISAPPRGIVPALNRAAAEARGEYLARMDADDIARPERLARQVALLDAHRDIVACGTRVRYVPRAGLRDGARRYERWINALVTPEDIERELFVECPIPHPTLMMRRARFEEVGGYRDGPFPEDYDLVFRLPGPGARLSKVPEVLLDWRESPDRLSRTDPRYGPDAFRRLKASYLLEQRVSGRPVVVWGAGPVGKAFVRELLALGVRVTAMVDLDPRKVGQVMHGAPVIAPDQVDRHRDAFIVAAVGRVGAREEIRAELTRRGWREVDEWCAVA